MVEHRHYQANQKDIWAEQDAKRRAAAMEIAAQEAQKDSLRERQEVELELSDWQVARLEALGLTDPAEIDRIMGHALTIERGIQALKALLA